MLFSKILVAYNETELAQKALDKAIAIAQTDPSIEIHVLTVVEFPVGAPYMAAAAWEMIDQSMSEYGESILEKAKQKLSAIPNPSKTYCARGAASRAILDYAAEHKCDLIAMGSRGLTGIREFLGSVSHHVVQHSPVPVLIVK